MSTGQWIPYKGERDSTCPRELLDKKVRVVLRIGYECAPRSAQFFTWENDGGMGNIVAYKIVHSRG